MRRIIIFFALCLVPALALSGGGKKSKGGKGWKIERKQMIPLTGSSKGQAGIVYVKKGEERQVRFAIKGADEGLYDLVAIRGDGRRQVLALLDHPREWMRVITADDPNFANLYSGYWDSFQAVRRSTAAVPPAPAPAPAATEPEADF